MSSSTATAHTRLAHICRQIAPQPTAAAAVPQSKHAQPVSLAAHLATLTPLIGSDQALATLLLSLASASAEISSILRGSTVAKIGSANNFGDLQLNVDVDTHEVRSPAPLSSLTAPSMVERSAQRSARKDELT